GKPRGQAGVGGVDAGCCHGEGDVARKLLTPGSRRSAVSWAIQHKGNSQRRACRLIGLPPITYRRVSRRSDDAAMRERLRALADQRRRFGYRRLGLLLAREGIQMNHKKLYRIYREERLAVRRRRGRKRALGTRAPMVLPQGVKQRWLLDCLSDALVDGRRFRVLAVVADLPRR